MKEYQMEAHQTFQGQAPRGQIWSSLWGGHIDDDDDDDDMIFWVLLKFLFFFYFGNHHHISEGGLVMRIRYPLGKSEKRKERKGKEKKRKRKKKRELKKDKETRKTESNKRRRVEKACPSYQAAVRSKSTYYIPT